VHVLVVEDDPRLGRLLSRLFANDRHVVDLATNGQDAIDLLDANRAFDAVVLDVGLPGMNGFDVARNVRAAGSRIPILMLTARDGLSDRVTGLDAGADDYLIKPFALQELLARLRALLRRSLLVGPDTPAAAPVTGALHFADLTLDPVTREVRRAGREIRLTRTEFSILEVFLRHPRQVLTRPVLFERVWGYDFGETSNSLHVYLGYLRRKLEAAGEPRLLHTVRGVGFVLREQPL